MDCPISNGAVLKEMARCSMASVPERPSFILHLSIWRHQGMLCPAFDRPERDPIWFLTG
jgi:hypothetical protein